MLKVRNDPHKRLVQAETKLGQISTAREALEGDIKRERSEAAIAVAAGSVGCTTASPTIQTGPDAAVSFDGSHIYDISPAWSAQPPSAVRITTSQGGSFQSISRPRAALAKAKSEASLTALVQTGSYSAASSNPTTAAFTPRRTD